MSACNKVVTFCDTQDLKQNLCKEYFNSMFQPDLFQDTAFYHSLAFYDHLFPPY